jgi:hypothetical protein
MRETRGLDGATDGLLGGTENEQRSDQQIEGDRRIAGLHLGHAGLAGSQLLGHLCLREVRLLPQSAQGVAQGELDLDERGLLGREGEEVFRATDDPAALL